MERTPSVFVVDDEPAVRRALERILRSQGFHVEGFSSAWNFLQRLPHDGVACAVVDLKMPGLSGLDLQDAMSQRGCSIPLVFLSGHSDVPSTAKAMREGAVDFLVKPIGEAALLDAVARAHVRSAQRLEHGRILRDAEARLARLTAREREVADLVVRGLLNKQIAYALGTTEKTIKVHRGRVMKKLQIDSVPALVYLLASAPARDRPC
jgi:FixJ family two-component response regulator